LTELCSVLFEVRMSRFSVHQFLDIGTSTENRSSNFNTDTFSTWQGTKNKDFITVKQYKCLFCHTVLKKKLCPFRNTWELNYILHHIFHNPNDTVHFLLLLSWVLCYVSKLKSRPILLYYHTSVTRRLRLTLFCVYYYPLHPWLRYEKAKMNIKWTCCLHVTKMEKRHS
jgi:hypothetical protein